MRPGKAGPEGMGDAMSPLSAHAAAAASGHESVTTTEDADGARGREGRRPERRLNAKRLLANRFADVVRRKNSE